MVHTRVDPNSSSSCSADTKQIKISTSERHRSKLNCSSVDRVVAAGLAPPPLSLDPACQKCDLKKKKNCLQSGGMFMTFMTHHHFHDVLIGARQVIVQLPHTRDSP